MKIIFLGTNGWYTTPAGNTACVLIDSEEGYVIFDAGNGFYQIDEYIKEDKPISLFISHFHLDHVNGLHILNKFSFAQGIDVYVGEGRSKDFTTLVHPPYTIGIDPKGKYHLPTEIRLHEVAEGRHTKPFPLFCKKLYHAYDDHGYQIELEGKTIAYSGDTGIGENSYALFQNVDMLIHECASEDGEKSSWGHTGPLETAQLAKDVGVKQLVLTHFDATDPKSREKSERKAREVFPKTIAAKDGMILTL